MSKVIKSPVPKYPGTVTLYDPLSFPQVIAIEDANTEADEFRIYKWLCSKCEQEAPKDSESRVCEECEGVIRRYATLRKDVSVAKLHNTLLPGLMPCVKEWNLEGLGNPPDPLPALPRGPITLLISWLVVEITNLFNESEKVPNE